MRTNTFSSMSSFGFQLWKLPFDFEFGETERVSFLPAKLRLLLSCLLLEMNVNSPSLFYLDLLLAIFFNITSDVDDSGFKMLECLSNNFPSGWKGLLVGFLFVTGSYCCSSKGSVLFTSVIVTLGIVNNGAAALCFAGSSLLGPNASGLSPSCWFRVGRVRPFLSSLSSN